MRRRQQPTPSPSSSSSDSDRSEIESCFDIGDEQEEMDANTGPTDVNTEIDGDDEADLADLEWLAHKEDPASTVPINKRLAETVITLPGTTIEEEFCRRNTAIDTVAAYYQFQEGGAAARPRARPFVRRASLTPSKETNPQLAAAEAEKQALSDAILLVFTEERTTTCFLCLGEQSLPFERRTYKFASPGDLTKHLKRKHLAYVREGDRL
ncbi:hypothetical protein EG329_006768 [Mollisiaceae sp. DMI_Dod_QoI]|nr:hypothetical protein EG329_006768 [Helotiales sp. DMI_Dod_QoI]